MWSYNFVAEVINSLSYQEIASTTMNGNETVSQQFSDTIKNE